jgi:hypothetical protein
VIGSAVAAALGGDHGWRHAAYGAAALLFAGSLGTALALLYSGAQRRG